MRSFTLFMRESGDIKIKSSIVIDKYDLSVPFGIYDTEELEETIRLKSDSGSLGIEIWHCFKLLGSFNRGYTKQQKVVYCHSEKINHVSGELIETYNIEKTEVD